METDELGSTTGRSSTVPASTGAGVTTDAGNEADVQQLKAEISDTQAELQQTVAEIQERLSPSHLKEQATDAVRDATVGRVQQMMTRAGDTLERATGGTREAASGFTAQVRSNPVPYALIGLGAAWLLMGTRSSRRNSWRDDGRSRASWATSPSLDRDRDSYEWSEYRSSSFDDSAGHDVYGVSGATSGVGNLPAMGADDYASGGDDYTSTRSMQDGKRRARQALSQARNRWDSIVDDNPLALGIVALAAGAIVGASMPVSDVENRYLGETRDQMLDSARSMAETAKQKVTETVQQVTGAQQ